MHDFYRVPGNVLIFSSGSFPKFSWYLEDFWCLLSFLILSLPGFYLFLTRSLLYFYFNNPSPECSSGLIVFLLSPAAQRETSEDCRSCLECSRDNGCVRCPERLFLFLQREGISHHGTCLHACPAGHYGQRGKDVNRCMKCRSSDCEQCFSRDFCTKCKPGFQLYKGKCLTHCPEGTRAHQTDCLENCVLAPLGEWSEWSVCLRDGVTCGFRWGKQTRTRVGGQTGKMPDDKAAPICPPHSETQRCRMKKKCTTGEKGYEPVRRMAITGANSRCTLG
uniref:R-spondin Fu-CRD domain-containing protein n=1 Tax=Pundamilia nyererei TaxID=303518 RepID=A0A3B4H680_9CICH